MLLKVFLVKIYWSSWVVFVVLGLAAIAYENVVEGNPTGNTTQRAMPTIPRHDPWQRHQPNFPVPDSSKRQQQQQQQTQIHLTFQPAPADYAAAQPTGSPPLPPGVALPTIYADYAATNAGATGLSNQNAAQSHANLVINPADIQFSVPDVPDEVSKKIIEQIRKQLGSQPVTLGELNNHFIHFTADIPSVLINRTMLTNVEESTIVDQRSTTYTTGSGYDGHPSKIYASYEPTAPIISVPYKPAAAATSGYSSTYDSSRSSSSSSYSSGGPDYGKSYSEQSYSYTLPEPSYAKAPEYQAPPPPAPAQYQMPPPTYQPPKPQESYQNQAPYQPPKDSYGQPQAQTYQKAEPSYAKAPEKSYTPPPPPAPYKKAPEPKDSYQKPAQPAYQAQPQYKTEEPKVIYKYIEVCSNPPQPTYQQPGTYQSAQQYHVPANPYVEIASGLAGSGYTSSYPSYGGLDLGKTSSEAQGATADGYNLMAKVYGEIHKRMDELEKLQRQLQEMQSEVSYASIPIELPLYTPPPPIPLPSYSQHATYSNGPTTGTYTTTVTSNSYSKSSPPAYYQQISYPAPPPPPPQKYPSTTTSYSPAPTAQALEYQKAAPYNGNQVSVQYKSTVEKLATNGTTAYP